MKFRIEKQLTTALSVSDAWHGEAILDLLW
jgi:hypothetical protein